MQPLQQVLTWSKKKNLIVELNFQTFQKIEQWRPQFSEHFGDRLVIGDKIAEGGQAEIFNIELTQSDRTPVSCHGSLW